MFLRITGTALLFTLHAHLAHASPEPVGLNAHYPVSESVSQVVNTVGCYDEKVAISLLQLRERVTPKEAQIVEDLLIANGVCLRGEVTVTARSGRRVDAKLEQLKNRGVFPVPGENVPKTSEGNATILHNIFSVSPN